MASTVSISVGGISVELGDEDFNAKYLTRLARKTVHELIEFVDERQVETEDEEGDSDVR